VVAEHPSILLFPNFLGHEDKQGSHDIPGLSFPQHNLHLPTCHDTRISNEAMEDSLASRDVFISCLLMKHLHKFYNRTNLPSVKLVWEIIASMLCHHQSLEKFLFGGEIVSNAWVLSRIFPSDQLVFFSSFVARQVVY
jgi:hypothetical protein